MKITYRITESDYVKATQLHYRPTLRHVLFLYLCGLAGVGISHWFSPVSMRVFLLSLPFIMLVVPILMLVWRHILLPSYSRYHYRKYKAIHEEITFEVLEDGIRLQTPDSNAVLAWDRILKWRDGKEYVLIYPMPALFYVVPKAVLLNDTAILTEKLTRHVGKPV